MNEQQNEKAPVKYHWGRLLAVGMAVLLFFVIKGCLTPPNIEYKTLDYDTVMRTPNLFRDEYAILEGEILQIIPTSDSEYKNIFLAVADKNQPDHVWIVYGPATADDAVKIQPGMDITARGVFMGTSKMTYKGVKADRPTLYSALFNYGYKIGGENHD